MYRIPSRITMASATHVLAEGTSAIESGETEFSLSELVGSDSSSLAVLLSWQRRAARHSAKLQFVDIPDELVTFAMLYGVDEFLPGFPAHGSHPSAVLHPLVATRVGSLPRQ